MPTECKSIQPTAAAHTKHSKVHIVVVPGSQPQPASQPARWVVRAMWAVAAAVEAVCGSYNTLINLHNGHANGWDGGAGARGTGPAAVDSLPSESITSGNEFLIQAN